jgi:hypothetical protein
MACRAGGLIDVKTQADEIVRQNTSIPTLSAWAAWGVQLLGDFSEAKVPARYENLRRKYFGVLGDKKPLVVTTNGSSGQTKDILREWLKTQGRRPNYYVVNFNLFADLASLFATQGDAAAASVSAARAIVAVWAYVTMCPASETTCSSEKSSVWFSRFACSDSIT